jgi:hypothetical protein
LAGGVDQPGGVVSEPIQAGGIHVHQLRLTGRGAEITALASLTVDRDPTFGHFRSSS